MKSDFFLYALFLAALMPLGSACRADELETSVPLPGNQESSGVDPGRMADEGEKSDHVHWISDLAEAQKIARAGNKDLLLFFTGSDWCAFCLKLEKQLLTTPEFDQYISTRYVPVVLDYPHKTKLPRHLTEQNEKLQVQFGVTSFPTMMITDSNALPYGTISGFNGADSYWEQMKQIAVLGEEIQQAKGGTDITAISDPETLDRVVSLVPEGLLLCGWPAQLQRLMSSSGSENEAFKAKWSAKLVELQKTVADREAIASATQALSRLKEEKADLSQMLAVINAGLADSRDRPQRMSFYTRNKIDLLDANGEYDQAVDAVKEMLASSWPNARERKSALVLQKQFLLAAGRLEEGLALVDEAENSKNYPSEAVRQTKLTLARFKALCNAFQYCAAQKYVPAVLKEVETGSPESKFIYAKAVQVCRATGRDPELLGRLHLLTYEVDNKNGSRLSGIGNFQAARAAVCFRAANLPDMVKASLALVDETRIPTTTPDGEPSLAPAQMAALREAAQGTQGDALKYLAENNQSIGRGVYLLEAAIALRNENRETEAKPLAAEALDILTNTDPKYPDKTAVEYLRKRAQAWSGE